MATRKRDRVLALSMAVFFFVVASALTIAVIFQAIDSKNKSNSNDGSDSTSTAAQKPSPNQLQGKPLAGFTPVSTVNQLKITDTKVGTGAAAKAGDTITVNYTGAVASTGIVFQSSLDNGQPASLSLNGVIKGWQLGIPGMKVGGTRRLLIPASEAYGATAQQGIPANSPLVFDVTLLKVGN